MFCDDGLYDGTFVTVLVEDCVAVEDHPYVAIKITEQTSIFLCLLEIIRHKGINIRSQFHKVSTYYKQRNLDTGITTKPYHCHLLPSKTATYNPG